MPSNLRYAFALTVAFVAAATVVPTQLAAQQRSGPSPEVRAVIDGAVAMLGTESDSALISFADKQLAPSYRESFTNEELLTHLQLLREYAMEADGSVGARGMPGSIVVTLNEAATVKVRIEWNDDLLITKLAIDDSEG